MKPAQESKTSTEKQIKQAIANEENELTSLFYENATASTTNKNSSNNLNFEINKPKITFQEHDPPTTQALPNLVLNLNNSSTQQPDCIKCSQCTCVLRSTSVGQIDTNQISTSTQQTTTTSSTAATKRPNTVISILKQQQSTIASNRTSSNSSSSSNETKAATNYPHHHIHCPHHRLLSAETTTHHLSNASPLLSFPKAISHNDATVFTRQITVPTSSQTGLEVRRLSDSAALHSSTSKPQTGPSYSSFMPTRRCVLRLDGCSYLIGKQTFVCEGLPLYSEKNEKEDFIYDFNDN